MDLPVIPMTLNMSNEELKKYQELYSQLVSEFAKLHNSNLSFYKYTGRDTGYGVRKHLRAIAQIASNMTKQGRSVCKEAVENKKLAKLAKREEKNNKKIRNVAIPK